MFIAYETVFDLRREEPGERSDLLVGNFGSRFLVSIGTSDFSVNHEGGKASINVSRHITAAQARELAAALVRAADKHDAEMDAYQTSVVVSTSNGPAVIPGSVSVAQMRKRNP